jgi:hypothetical protein
LTGPLINHEMKTNMKPEKPPTLHARRRRRQAHHRTRSQRSPHGLATNRPNNRRQTTQCRQRRAHRTYMDRKVPKSRYAKEQEASRTGRFHRWCKNQIPHELDVRPEGATQANSMSLRAQHKTQFSFLVHFSIVRCFLATNFHRALSERNGVGGVFGKLRGGYLIFHGNRYQAGLA